MAETFDEDLKDIARQRGILRDQVGAAEAMQIDEAIALVTSVMPNDQTDGLVEVKGGEEQTYEMRNGVLLRSSVPLQGEGADLQSRRAFAVEAVLVVQTIAAQSERNIGAYQLALKANCVELTDEQDRELTEVAGAVYSKPSAADSPTELSGLREEVTHALELRGNEDRLARIVQEQAMDLADREGRRLRAAGVPGADVLFGGVEHSFTESCVELLTNWETWEANYEHELIVNRMLSALERAMTGDSWGSIPYERPEGRRGAYAGEGGHTDAFEGEARLTIADGTLHVHPVRLDRPTGTYPVKNAQGVRDESAINALLDGYAFTEVLKSFAQSHRTLHVLCDVLAASPLHTDEVRSRLQARAAHHKNVRNEIPQGTPVDAKTIDRLEHLAGAVERLRESEAEIKDEIDTQAAHLASAIRARLDTGEDSVSLAQGYTIQTVTEPSEPDPNPARLRRLSIGTSSRKTVTKHRPRQCRVIVDARTGNESVEPVPWLPRDQSAAQMFVSRSALMVKTMQGRGPVVLA